MTKDKSILIKNIYFMLSYAFTTLHQSNFENIATEEFDNIHDLFAAILAKGIGQQLKQGLYREYINKTEDLSVIRGKINMPGTIRSRIANRMALTCEYDEMSENNALNRILKTTAFLLMRLSDVETKYKDDLKKEMLFFSNVETVKPTLIRWSSIRFQNNNQTYRMLISICQLIIEGMLLTTEQGKYRLASFVDEQRMSRLYEKFILEYYRKEHPELNASAPQIAWNLDSGSDKNLPVMQTDITLSRGEKTLIIDAKYYGHSMQLHYDKMTFHPNNMFQIFAYVKNRDVNKTGKIGGMLLYAKTEENITPDADLIVDGSSISVKTLDLNKPFPVIKEQLDNIAGSFFDV